MNFCIVGTSRSGSTLLRHLLAASPDIDIFNETQWLPILYDRFGDTPIPFSTLLDHAMSVTWDTGENLIDHNILHYAGDSTKVYERIEAEKVRNVPLSVADFHHRMKDIIFGENSRIYGDKTPDYGPYMHQIQAIWPQCRFIHITRDALDCALSMQRHPGCRLLIHANKVSWVEVADNGRYLEYASDPLSLDDCIKGWAKKMRAIRDESQRLSPGSYLEVTYNDLIGSPEALLGRIHDFIGVPFRKSTELERQISRIHRKSINRARNVGVFRYLSLEDLACVFPSLCLDTPCLSFEQLQPLLPAGHDEVQFELSCLQGILDSRRLKDDRAFLSWFSAYINFLLKIEPASVQYRLKEMVDYLDPSSSLIGHLIRYLAPTCTTEEPADESDAAVTALLDGLIRDQKIDAAAFLTAVMTIIRPGIVYERRLLHLLNRKNCMEALVFFGEKTLVSFPEHRGLWLLLIRGHIFTRDLDRAQTLMTRIGLSREKPGEEVLYFHYAMAKNDYRAAVETSQALIKAESGNSRFHIFHARALDHAGKPERAEKALVTACTLFDDKAILLNALTELYVKYHQWKKLLAVCRKITEVAPSKANTERRFQACLQLGDFDGAEGLLARMDSQQRPIFSARIALRKREFLIAEALLQSGEMNEARWLELAEFYCDIDQPAQAFRILEKHGLAENETRRVILLRARLLMKREGAGAALAFISDMMAKYPAEQAFHFLAIDQQICQELFGQAEKQLLLLRERFGDSLQVRKKLANIYISQGKNQAAMECIEHIPAFSLDLVSVRLKCWALYQRNLFSRAKLHWYRYESNHYIPELHDTQDDFSQAHLSSAMAQKNDIVLFTVVRNEELLLSQFVAHYRQLGVTRFIIIDNGSTDGSVEALAGDSDIFVFRQNRSYKTSCYGMQWVNALKNHLAPHNWCIYADADEFMVLPEKYYGSLDALVKALEDERCHAATGFMLDMYPKTLADAEQYTKGANPLQFAGFFDNHYQISATAHAPFMEIYGGFRQRFFWQQAERGNALVKTPIVKGRAVNFLSSSHIITPAKVAQLRVVLLHFKFLGDCKIRFAEEVKRKEHAMVSEEYQRYRDVLYRTKADTSLLSNKSLPFEGAAQLEALGLMQAQETL